MQGRTYSVSFSGSSLAAQFDAFEITADTTKVVEVLEIHLSQSTIIGDAQEESLLVLIKSGQTVSGSGGGIPAAVPRIFGAAAFAGVVKTANTTKASGGVSEVLVDRTTGTAIGDMTSNGGLAASFDGTTSQALASCSRVAGFPTNGYVGKTWSTAKTFARATVYGSNNQGFLDTDNRSCTITIRGKNGAAPTDPTDGTSLGSITFNDTSNESAGRSITSIDTTTAYDHWFAQILLNEEGVGQMNCAEVAWWEAASASQIVTHQAQSWNIRVPLDIYFSRSTAIIIPPGGRLTVEVATTPSGPIAFSGNMIIREIGATTSVSGLPSFAPALRAQSFLDKHGINVQIDRTDRGYSSFHPTSSDLCIAHMAELNMTLARAIWKGGSTDATHDAKYDYWAAAGIKFSFHSSAGGWYAYIQTCVDEIAAFETAFPGAVTQIEGPNELNWTYQTRRQDPPGSHQYLYTNRLGVTYGSYQEMIKRQEDLLYLVRNTSPLTTKPVVLYENAPNVWALNGSDFHNKHLYPNQAMPEYTTWLWLDQTTYTNTGYGPQYTSPFPTRLRQKFETELAWWHPSKPLQMTEFGWHTIGMNGNYEHIALNTIFTWLMLATTYDKLFFFELIEGNSPATQTEDCFGLWSGANPHVKRASAQYLINFRAALVDAGGTSFTLTNAQYNLTGLPALGRTLLLQKQNGEHLLLIWREDPYWSGQGGAGAPITVSPVTLSLEVPAGKTVQWICPSIHSTNTVSPSLGKHPLLARIF